jgi:low affinity Fe/Cu permease
MGKFSTIASVLGDMFATILAFILMLVLVYVCPPLGLLVLIYYLLKKD